MPDHAWRTFADLSVNLDTGELRRHGTPVPLERQPALVLVRLVEEAGQLVTRDSLRRAVWPADTHVDYDRGLNYCLRQLRIALGDDARAPRFIETIPRQGYRFIAATVSAPIAGAIGPANATASEPAHAVSAAPKPEPEHAPSAELAGALARFNPLARHRTLVAAGLAATLVLLTVVVERGPRNERHHAIAVAVVRTVHNWLF